MRHAEHSHPSKTAQAHDDASHLPPLTEPSERSPVTGCATRGADDPARDTSDRDTSDRGAPVPDGSAQDTAPAFSVVPGAPRSDDPALIAHLHADLVAAGFTVDGVTDLVGEQA